MRNKNFILLITVLFVGLALAGGTYAFLTSSVNITNNVYNTVTGCFNVDYTIDNGDNTQDITGTLFPSTNASGGLNGRVGIKANTTCGLNGIGTLKLHINSETSSTFMTSASSYCEDRGTMEPITGISTEADCQTTGGRWRGYGDSYCESNTTLERLTDYTDSSSCANHSGTWKSGGSPLKYAVYSNATATGAPLSKGYITAADIGNDVTIYDGFIVDATQDYYYVFIWLDGYLVDNSVNNLSFGGYIKAEAVQANFVYTVNTNAYITLEQAIPSSVTQYTTPTAAMSAFNNYPFFLMHRMQGGVVSETYLGFVVTSAMVQDNSGLTAGTYYLKAFINESNLSTQPTFIANRAILLSAFSSSNCNSSGIYYHCEVASNGLEVYIYKNGDTWAELYTHNGGVPSCNAAYDVASQSWQAYCTSS